MAGEEAYGAIDDAAIAVQDGRIAWVGPRTELPNGAAGETVDLGGRWVTPGLIDCHTHVVFGGTRAREFEMRLEGASYEAIARAGGGILSTVRDTRAATDEALLAGALEQARERIQEGVTVLEIKSGYGLDDETEARMLRVARQVGEHLPVTVRTTCLAAHALPPEYAERPNDYIDRVCDRIIPHIAEAGLADAVASPSMPPRPSGSSRSRAPTACRSSCMPNSSPIRAARKWRRATARCPWTTSNTSPKPACAPWPRPAASP
jgi:imidazolonepropionase